MISFKLKADENHNVKKGLGKVYQLDVYIQSCDALCILETTLRYINKIAFGISAVTKLWYLQIKIILK